MPGRLALQHLGLEPVQLVRLGLQVAGDFDQVKADLLVPSSWRQLTALLGTPAETLSIFPHLRETV